jgi:hypothetical protein
MVFVSPAGNWWDCTSFPVPPHEGSNYAVRLHVRSTPAQELPILLSDVCFFLRSTFLTGFVLLLAVVNIPLRAQIVDVVSAVKSGLQLLPLVGGCALGSAIGGGASFRKNNAYITLNLASALMLLGCGLLSTLPESGAHTSLLLGYGFIMGLGIGISLSTMTFITSLQVLFVDHGKFLNSCP